jgi:hypothetical protein
MPVTYELCENGHAIHINITYPWTTRELIAIYENERPLFDHATSKLHTLVDVTESRQTPSNALSARKDSPHFEHPNKGHLVIVGANPLIQALVEATIRIIRFEELKFCRTADEGWAYLREVIASEISAQLPAR